MNSTEKFVGCMAKPWSPTPWLRKLDLTFFVIWSAQANGRFLKKGRHCNKSFLNEHLDMRCFSSFKPVRKQVWPVQRVHHPSLVRLLLFTAACRGSRWGPAHWHSAEVKTGVIRRGSGCHAISRNYILVYSQGLSVVLSTAQALPALSLLVSRPHEIPSVPEGSCDNIHHSSRCCVATATQGDLCFRVCHDR